MIWWLQILSVSFGLFSAGLWLWAALWPRPIGGWGGRTEKELRTIKCQTFVHSAAAFFAAVAVACQAGIVWFGM